MPLVAFLAVLAATAALGQEPPGCTLLDGQLRCSPGVGAAPLARIPIVLSGSAQQPASSLSGLTPHGANAAVALQGRAQEGAWLQASVDRAGLPLLSDGAYHWYHKPPGRLRWEFIEGASGPAYQLQRGDMAYEVMVVVVVPSPDGCQRLLSNSLGPVLARGATPP
jgi:hypothetical protein